MWVEFPTRGNLKISLPTALRVCGLNVQRAELLSFSGGGHPNLKSAEVCAFGFQPLASVLIASRKDSNSGAPEFVFLAAVIQT
jgi:hypothetical protein